MRTPCTAMTARIRSCSLLSVMQRSKRSSMSAGNARIPVAYGQHRCAMSKQGANNRICYEGSSLCAGRRWPRSERPRYSHGGMRTLPGFHLQRFKQCCGQLKRRFLLFSDRTWRSTRPARIYATVNLLTSDSMMIVQPYIGCS